LLCNSLHYRSGRQASFVAAHRRVEHHNNRHGRILYRRKGDKGSVVLRLRVAARRWIDLLCRPRFPRSRVSIQLRELARAPQYNRFHHRLHLFRSLFIGSPMRIRTIQIREWPWALDISHNCWVVIRAAVCHGRDRRNYLNRRHADFLSHRDRTNGTGRPFRNGPEKPAIFAWKRDACRLPYAKGANSIVKALRSHAKSHLDRSYVARMNQNVADTDDAKARVVVNNSSGHIDRSHLAIDQLRGICKMIL